MLEAHRMDHETTRRDFLRGGTLATAGVLAANSAGNAQDGTANQDAHKHDHGHSPSRDFPRDHAGPGGPLGSATDRGKLVPGFRAPGGPRSRSKHRTYRN